MCGGMTVQGKNPKTGEPQIRKVFFPIPHAQIPVITPSGVTMAQWGRRQGEDSEFDVPITGWARLASLADGKWNQYEPQRVKIPALSWMEKDAEKQSHWFDLDPRQYLLGVAITRQERSFVYVVTQPAQGEFQQIHDRIPLIVSGEPKVIEPSTEPVQRDLFTPF